MLYVLFVCLLVDRAASGQTEAKSLQATFIFVHIPQDKKTQELWTHKCWGNDMCRQIVVVPLSWRSRSTTANFGAADTLGTQLSQKCVS